MAEILELQTNVPEVVALAYAEGREYPSRIAGAPPQVMFTLVDGRRVFWPQPFAESLRNSGIGARVPFEIVKRELAKGKTQLQFRAINTTPAARTANAGVSTSTQTTEQSHPTPAPTAAQKTCTQTLAGALIASIDAYLIAVEYAKAKGIECSIPFLEFTAEDVRMSATSLMIECFKRGAA